MCAYAHASCQSPKSDILDSEKSFSAIEVIECKPGLESSQFVLALLVEKTCLLVCYVSHVIHILKQSVKLKNTEGKETTSLLM